MADITKIDTCIQSSPHPAWLATTQGYRVYANPALERLTGFDQIRSTKLTGAASFWKRTEPSPQLLGKGPSVVFEIICRSIL
jgi:PAS domain-containing protein